MPPGWALGILAFLLFAPGVFVLGPLAGLLLVARPVSRQAWLWLVAGVAWTASWLVRTGDLPGQFTRAFAVVMLGCWLILLLLRPGRVFERSLLAATVALAITFGWLLALGLGWGDLQAATGRALSDLLLTQAHGLGGSDGSGLTSAFFDVAGQARWLAALLPAGLLLAALVGTSLAWRAHFWLVRQPLGPAPRAFAAFSFSDHLVWLLVLAALLLLVPLDPRLDTVRVAGSNLLVVALLLYAVRGAAVLAATTGRVSLPVALSALLVALLMFVFVAGGLALLGIADTWLDFRRRTAPASGGRTP